MIRFGRRHFLGGAATLIGLPWLESLGPKSARAAERAAPKRLICFFVPNGLQPERWLPSETGTDFPLSPILRPFEPRREQLLLVSGLRNGAAVEENDGDHLRGTGTFLTSTRLPLEGPLANGVSLDQLAVQAWRPGTRFPSVQLGLEAGSNSGQCDGDYRCAYQHNISWATPSTPLPKMIEPRLVFERLFAGTEAAASGAAARRRRARKQSVLDYVRQDAQGLAARVSARDRSQLDEYLSGLRELELLVQSEGVVGQCAAEAPDGNLERDPGKAMEAMSALMAAAFQCDLTRVFSFMTGPPASSRAYPFLGVEEAHHELSHHDDDPEKLAQLDKIIGWEVAAFADLAARLDHLEEEGGSVLDHTIMLLGSDIVDGNRHDHRQMPVLMAGGRRAGLRTGQHVRYGGDEPLANLHRTVLDALGVPVEKFGEDGELLLPELRGEG